MPSVTRLGIVPNVKRLQLLFGVDKRNPSCCKQALFAGAQTYLNFISLTRPYLSENYPDEWLKRSAARYIEYSKLRQRKQTPRDLVPSRDISLFWATDMLSPTTYKGFAGKGETQLDFLNEEETLIWKKLGQVVQPMWFFHQQCRVLQYSLEFEGIRQGKREWSTPEEVLLSAMVWGTAGAILGKNPLSAGVASALGAASNLRKDVVIPLKKGSQAKSKMLPIMNLVGHASELDQQKYREAMKSWLKMYKESAILWRNETGSVYKVPPHKKIPLVFGIIPSEDPDAIPRGSNADIEVVNKHFMIDNGIRIQELVDRVKSQAKFHRRILRLGPRVINDDWIWNAVDRYCMYLELVKENPGKIHVPTLDIDLIWHVHMLSPRDYHGDCLEIFGNRGVLKHETENVTDQQLQRAFKQTGEEWNQKFGGVYVARIVPSQKKGTWGAVRDREKKEKKPNYAGCGSCGFGDESFHDSLGHEERETQMIDSANGHHDKVDNPDYSEDKSESWSEQPEFGDRVDFTQSQDYEFVDDSTEGTDGSWPSTDDKSWDFNDFFGSDGGESACGSCGGD